jgi:hypothetical protein
MVIWLGLAPGHASADYLYDFAAPTWIPADVMLRTLASVRFWRNAGAKLFIDSRLEIDSPTTRLLVGGAIACSPGYDNFNATPVFQVWRTQNVENIPENDSVVLRARGLFQAPATGWYTCWLSIKNGIPGVGACSDPGCGYQAVSPGTWISALDVAGWAAQSYQGSKVLMEPGHAYDVAVLNFTAPANVSSFRATSDLEMTNCYDPSPLNICDGPYDPSGPSSVQTRLQVMQKAVGGGYCQITNYPASGYLLTTISWSEHHKPAYHSVIANVSTASECTRDFRIKVYVRGVTGNDVHLEKKPYTLTWVR